MASLQLTRPIAFFDLETTGLDQAKDRIVEIAIVKWNPDGSIEEYERRINPEIHISEESSSIHGIYDEDVANEPTFKEVAHEIATFIKNCDLGGYNSNKFDLPVLAEEFLRAGHTVDFNKRKLVDVQQVFYKKEPRTLAAAYKFYCNEELVNAHSALADVKATVEVLKSQLERYDDIGNTAEALHNFTGSGEIVDYARRIMLKDGEYYFNFGKHKGKKVKDVLKAEPQYYDWMMQSDFPLHTKQCLTEILNSMYFNKK
jgi:DNA polymerase-3 subunit epsilon